MKKKLYITILSLTMLAIVGCGNSKELEALKTTVSEKDAIIAEKDAEIADLNNQISELNTTITDLQNQIDELNKQFSAERGITEEDNTVAKDIEQTINESINEDKSGYKENYIAPATKSIDYDGSEITVYGSQTDPCTIVPTDLKPGDVYWIKIGNMVFEVVYGG